MIVFASLEMIAVSSSSLSDELDESELRLPLSALRKLLKVAEVDRPCWMYSSLKEGFALCQFFLYFQTVDFVYLTPEKTLENVSFSFLSSFLSCWILANPSATSQTKKSFGHFRSQDIVAVGSDFGAGFDLGIIGREFGAVLIDPALGLS